MSQINASRKQLLVVITAVLLMGIVTMSFIDFPYADEEFKIQQNCQRVAVCADTVPDRHTMKLRDFDRLQKELDNSKLVVEESLKNLDFKRMQQDLDRSIKEINIEKIQQDVNLALKKVDMDKLMAEVSTSLTNLKLNNNQLEIEAALAEARKEIAKAKLEVSAIDRETIRKDFEKAKAGIAQSKLEISKIDKDKIITEARTSIDKAKAELAITKSMLTEMEKEGLVSSKQGYTVEFKNNELFINGEKQPEKTAAKYRKYLHKENFKIKIDKD